ncbi:MAG: hypothetical protein QM484_03655 [Woeseiaceae bacterium]
MLDDYLQLSFILLMAMSIIAVVGFIPLLLIQHFIHKKILDPIFFNSKHYSSYQLEVFTSFPLLLVKTIGYIKAIVFPSTMRRKFESNILVPKNHPATFVLAWVTMLFLIAGSLIMINSGFMAYFHYQQTP